MSDETTCAYCDGDPATCGHRQDGPFCITCHAAEWVHHQPNIYTGRKDARGHAYPEACDHFTPPAAHDARTSGPSPQPPSAADLGGASFRPAPHAEAPRPAVSDCGAHAPGLPLAWCHRPEGHMGDCEHVYSTVAGPYVTPRPDPSQPAGLVPGRAEPHADEALAKSAVEAPGSDADGARDSLYAAVRYALCRIQGDGDFGYQAGYGTEVFRLLCVAEAAHLGRPVDDVERERRRTFWPYEPRVLELRRQLDEARR